MIIINIVDAVGVDVVSYVSVVQCYRRTQLLSLGVKWSQLGRPKEL